MYYFKQTKTDIEKYKVIFDIELLNQLKREIIKNCSTVVHEEWKSDTPPMIYYDNASDEYEIKNFIWHSTGKYQEYFEEDREIYSYQRDKVIYPSLVIAINDLMKGKVDAIRRIFGYSEANRKKLTRCLRKQISKLSGEINEITNTDFNEKRKKLNELEQLVSELEKSKLPDPILPYYEKVQELISIQLVDTISIAEIDKVMLFFQDENSIDPALIAMLEEKGITMKKRLGKNNRRTNS